MVSDEAWAKEKEVLVTGSDAIGCKTKVKDDWFWASCKGAVAIRTVDVLVGKHKTQTHADVVGDELRIVTPYVEGTEFLAHVGLDAGQRYLRITWRKGKRPFEVGRITESR
jgi:hypothetical protein